MAKICENLRYSGDLLRQLGEIFHFHVLFPHLLNIATSDFMSDFQGIFLFAR